MTTSVSPPNRAPDARTPRPRNGDPGSADLAFDAALAAQWMLNAHALQASPANSALTSPGTRSSPSSPHVRASTTESSGPQREHDDRAAAGFGAASPTPGRSPAAPGLTQLSSKELAGQLPSRKEMLRDSQSANADDEASPPSGRTAPAERGPSAGTSSAARTSSSAPGVAPATPHPVHASGTPSLAAPNSSNTPAPAARASNPNHQLTTSPVAPGSNTRTESPASAVRTLQPARASIAASTAPPARVAGMTDALARPRPVVRGVKPPSANPAPSKGTLEPNHPVAAQALRGLAAALRQGNGSVTLQMSPENLGRLRLSIAVKPSEVVARVEATSEEAAQALRQNSSQLREALEAQGFAVSRIEVDHVSHALLQVRERATMEQHATPQQWGSDARSGQQQPAPAHGESRRESLSSSPSGTPLAVEPRIEQAFISADGVNALA